MDFVKSPEEIMIDEKINDALSWKLVGTATGTDEIALPNSFKELMINVENGTDNAPYILYVQSILLSSNYKTFETGAAYATTSMGGSAIAISLKSIKQVQTYTNGTSITNSTNIHVYYR